MTETRAYGTGKPYWDTKTRARLSAAISRVESYPLAREKVMNREYLEAKFDLCINQAEKDLQEQDIAQAIANLKRANSAMARLFGIEEEAENE